MTFLKYLSGVWSATSQLANVVLLRGHPNESISGRCHREEWRFKRVVNAIFWWQVDHCKGAYINDLRWAKWYAENENMKAGQ